MLTVEVDLTISGINRKAFIKGRGEEISSYVIPADTHFCENSSKISRHLEQLLAIRNLIANSAHSSVCGLFLQHAVVGVKNKFGSCFCWHGELLNTK